MHVKPRSYLTSGIAALGVGAITLSPIQPIPTQVAAAPQHVVSTMAVDLAATVNPIQAWVDTGKATLANGVTLLQFYLDDPFPLFRAVASNQATYLKELLSGNAKLIFPQIKNNIQTLFQAPLDPGPTAPLINTNTDPSTEAIVPFGLPGAPGNLSDTCNETGNRCGSPADLNLLALQLASGLSQTASPDNPDSWKLWQTLVGPGSAAWRFTTSFASGLLMGAAGVVLSPLVSLSNSIKAFVADLKARQFVSAVYDILNIPANMTNAFFNGAGFWDLSKIVEKFIPPDPDADIQLGKVGLKLGGLLNLTPTNGSLVDPDNPPTTYNGGVALDSLAGEGDGFFGANGIRGIKVGLGGSMVGMGQFLGEKLRVTPPVKSAAVRAKAAAAIEAPAEESAPAASAPVGRKAARAAAADDNGGATGRAAGHARSARSSR